MVDGTPTRAAPGGRLAAIDICRGIAVLAVVVSHAQYIDWPSWVEHVSYFGRFGVHLFLVLSGFCIHMRWARTRAEGRLDAPLGFGEFWRRRLYRLYPPYFAALLLTVAGLWLFTRLRGPHGVGIAAQLGYTSGEQLAIDLALLVVLAQNLTDASRRIGNAPFWTLALEEQLYMLYFPLLWMRRRWGWGIALGVAAACTLVWRGIGIAIFGENPPFFWLVVGPARWLEWGLGALAVEASLGIVTLPAWARSPFVALGTLVASTLINEHIRWHRASPWQLVADAAFGLAFFLVVNVACERRWGDAPASWLSRGFAWVGLTSYSLYLTHLVTQTAARHAAMRAHLPSVLVVGLQFAVPIVGAWVFFRVVERHFLTASRGRRVAVAPVPTRE